MKDYQFRVLFEESREMLVCPSPTTKVVSQQLKLIPFLVKPRVAHIIFQQWLEINFAAINSRSQINDRWGRKWSLFAAV